MAVKEIQDEKEESEWRLQWELDEKDKELEELRKMKDKIERGLKE